MFNPSQKQKEAIRLMSELLGIYPTEEFKTYQEFQDHFIFLQKQLEKKKKIREKKKEIKLSPELLQKKQEKIYLYYQKNPKKLVFKALEYKERYNPSHYKIEQYILKKIGKNREDSMVQEILSQIPNTEWENIVRKVYILRHLRTKSHHEILGNLLQKKYDTDLVQKAIKESQTQEKEQGPSEEMLESIQKKIRMYLSQGKTIREIEWKLYFLISDKTLLQEMLEKERDPERENDKMFENIKKKWYHYKGDKRKVLSWALWKGYEYQKINTILNSFQKSI